MFTKKQIKITQKIGLFLLGLVLTSLPIKPSCAAEKVIFRYKFADVSVQVKDLENFAKTGNLSQELHPLITQLTPEEQKGFRQVLLQSHKINIDRLIRFLNTSIGQKLLSDVGKLITVGDGENGKQAFIMAIESTAKSSQGFTLLNLIRQFPGNLQFNIDQMLLTARLVGKVVSATNDIVKVMREMSAIETQNSPVIDFTKKTDLRKPGGYNFAKEQWKFYDQKRQREILVDVYKPLSFRSGKTPVILASHGLASNPEHFLKRAQHLASYGYLVVVPKHSGSDYNYANKLLQGKVTEVFDVQEFIDRPYDISYVLDELEKRNKSEFKNRLNLTSVGIMGHSFGGYTALAVGGAEIDFDNLQRECNHQLRVINLSELLQCEALKIPRKNYKFRDPRIKAISAGNPVNSSIFGVRGLGKVTIPTLIGAGSKDPATPIIFEQFRSFPWIKSPDKYLALAEGQAHLNSLQLDGQMSTLVNSGQHFTLPSPELITDYSNAMTLAFFEVYIAQNKSYQIYVQSSYAEYLSKEQDFKLFLITNASLNSVKKEVEKLQEIFEIIKENRNREF